MNRIFTTFSRKIPKHQHLRTMSTQISEFQGLVTGITSDKTFPSLNSEIQSHLVGQLEQSGAKGKRGDCRVLYPSNGEFQQVAVVGLGKQNEAEATRTAAAVGIKTLRERGISSISVDPMGNSHAAAEGAHLALYCFDELKSSKPRPVPSIKLAGSEEGKDGLNWKTGLIYAEAQNLARRLMEMPANLMSPRIFAEQAKKSFEGIKDVEVIVREKEWAESKGMNAFLSVAKGSSEPLRFVEIHYNGDAKNKNDLALALVGKGVTFDAGGISIKPSDNMASMKGDMGGAATVLSTLYGIARLGLPLNVKGFIPLCENLPSGTASKPGDVVKAMNGKSIEIVDTDAEGRMILADAIYYASSTYRPRTLLDVATLTGSVIIALGELYASVFTNSTSLFRELEAAGEAESDPFWRMPLHSGYMKQITTSTTADLINYGGRAAGACTAAIFLKEFVYGLSKEVNEESENDDDDELGEVKNEEKIRYAHIDIASVMETNSSEGYNVKGMTGRPTRSLIEFARRLAQK
ncbi:uncharacterized protein VTP21DRAFT_6743 [Calcarisporiella thermophila]|uniref:uncharacterized protein n=1 Tax=Calcarisporiella thermophila TaxID=911321 RepID=UPI003742DF51